MEQHTPPGPPPGPPPRRLFVIMLVAVPVALVALVVVIALVIRALSPEEVPEATLEDYCDAVHGTWDVTATAHDDGVLVTWQSMSYDEPGDYVVHRRPAGSPEDGEWQRVAAVTVGPVERGEPLSHLDTTPAEQPGTAYEYGVSHVIDECGGESEPDTFDPPTAPGRTATPPPQA